MEGPAPGKYPPPPGGMRPIPAIPPQVSQDLQRVRIEVREEQAPYFTDADLLYYYQKNNGDLRATIYELLIIKSEDSSIQLSGYSSGDTSAYFKRLASKYTARNSGNLGGENV